MHPDQCRAARALLDLTRPELAKIARVGLNVIGKFENGTTQPTSKTLSKLRAAFSALGIRFINDEDGVGVRRAATPEEVSESADFVDRIRPLKVTRIDPVTGPIAPEQSRAARAFLGYSQSTAAREAGIGLSMLVAFETGLRIPKSANIERIRAMYERKGVVFTEVDGRPAVQFLGTSSCAKLGPDRSATEEGADEAEPARWREGDSRQANSNAH
ncbi:helix-turn-helix domain-containing protein [Enterovirga aerilata]|uniref:Transcriptional regulator n=1 Tax=Enterovirga aerilata TaxID=2730920 RepID=A0A849IJV9_9HYPH|nr:helix-turn-helix domain-containing protein [Enterovirga sp. DB1703]NNM74223.1 transcriptional regulator [Enterovirga sp. DB1703]